MPLCAESAELAFDFEKDMQGWSAGTDCRAALVSGDAGGQAVEVKVAGTSATLRLPQKIKISQYRALQFRVKLPHHIQAHTHLLAYFVDEGDWWFQSWRRIKPKPGEWERMEIDLRSQAGQIEPLGHSRPWGPYVARGVTEMGLRLFADKPINTTILLDDIRLIPVSDEKPPISNDTFSRSSGSKCSADSERKSARS